MTTKRTLILVGRILGTTLCMILFLFTFEILKFFKFMGYTFEKFIEEIDAMMIIFFCIFSAFFLTNEWLRTQKKVYKPFPYFLYVLSIPTLVSALISYLKNINEKYVFEIHVNLILSAVIATLFLAIVHHLKYNFKVKEHSSRKIVWKTTTMYKSVLMFTIGLAFIYEIFMMAYFMSHSESFFSNFNSDLFFFFCLQYLGGFCISFICWHLVLLFYNYLSQRVSFFVLLLITTFGILVMMQFFITVFNFVKLLTYLGDYEILTAFLFDFKQDLIYFDTESIFVVFSTLSYQFFYFNKTRTAEQKAFKAEIGKQTEKYESLRRQLSPHFLFNNINVLTALIEENPKKAVRFSEALGNIYRHFLRQEDEDVVSLKSALSFSKDYLELLKYRHEDAFQYVLPEAVDANQYIIPLALQQVIENAIKHNEVSKEKPLQITIGVHENYIVISNTKQLKTNAEKNKGTGIENIHKRYAFLTEKTVVIEDEVNSFVVKLPLLTMENL